MQLLPIFPPTLFFLREAGAGEDPQALQTQTSGKTAGPRGPQTCEATQTPAPQTRPTAQATQTQTGTQGEEK